MCLTLGRLRRSTENIELFQILSSGGGVGCRHFFVLWGEGVLLTTCPRGGGSLWPILSVGVENNQRQTQPNQNKLCGYGCLTATEWPNGRTLVEGPSYSLIRIYRSVTDVLQAWALRTGICRVVYSLQLHLSSPFILPETERFKDVDGFFY